MISKTQQRRELIKIRNSITELDRMTWNDLIVKNLMGQEFWQKKINLNQTSLNFSNNLTKTNLIIHTYWSANSEVDTHWLLDSDKILASSLDNFRLANANFEVVIPKVISLTTMEHCLVNSQTIFGNNGKFIEPVESHQKFGDLESIDIVIVPLVGFNFVDNTIHRIGYGGGYYDRFLSQLKEVNSDVILVGLAYDCQKIQELSVELHDIPLDYVITQSRVFSS